MSTTSRKMPARKSSLHITEMACAPSDDVLIKAKGVSQIMLGRYCHGWRGWQADHVHGDIDVTEWWPIPEVGTGTPVIPRRRYEDA